MYPKRPQCDALLGECSATSTSTQRKTRIVAPTFLVPCSTETFGLGSSLLGGVLLRPLVLVVLLRPLVLVVLCWGCSEGGGRGLAGAG